MNFVGTIFYPLSYLASPISILFSRRANDAGSKSAAQGLATSAKICALIRHLNTLNIPPNAPGMSPKKMTEVLSQAARMLDQGENRKRFTVLIDELENLLTKQSQQVFDLQLIQRQVEKIECEEKEICAKELENNLLRSVVWMDMNNQGEYESRHLVLNCTKGEIHYKTDKKLTQSTDQRKSLNTNASSARTRMDYINMLDAYEGETDRLDSRFVEDIVNGPDLNVPSDIEVAVGNEFVLIRSQTALDIGRMHYLYVNGRLIFDKSKGIFLKPDRPEQTTVEKVFLQFAEMFDNDVKMANRITKLLTQASFARPCELVTFGFTNASIGMLVTSGLKMGIAIETLDQKTRQPLPSITIRLQIIFGIMNTENAEFIRYINVLREFIIPLASFAQGTVKGSRIIDSYSKFFSDLKNMN